MRSRLLACALALPAALYGAPALADVPDAAPAHERVHAPSPGTDGVYERLDGSLALSGSLGAELEGGEPRGALRLAAHYLWTAGVYARYSDAFGSADERPQRVASFGVDLRPLFLPRFALDLEQGPAWLDLTLDSLSLTAGAYFAGGQRLAREVEDDRRRRSDFGDERGFETGLGLAVPLCGSARGVWLEARAERRFADRGPSAWLFTLALSLHALTWTTQPEPR
ncbi:MAG TPA: hypothetical protein VEQ58_08555 [Polyangiaceae bacterium]|nr:hypothetical protein [Polyangiaceae bacterium]